MIFFIIYNYISFWWLCASDIRICLMSALYKDEDEDKFISTKTIEESKNENR